MIVNSLDTYCLESLSIHVFALLYNEIGESTVVRASTLIEFLSNLIKLNYEVYDRVIEKVVHASKRANEEKVGTEESKKTRKRK